MPNPNLDKLIRFFCFRFDDIRMRATYLLSFILLFLSLTACFQSDKANTNIEADTNQVLSLQSPVSDTIVKGSKHRYFFDLEANRFVLIRAVRHSFAEGEEVNMLLTIRSADNDIIEQTNTASGSSLITLFSDKAGRHSIEVSHWNGADTGNFSLYLDINEPAENSKIKKVGQLLQYIYSDERPGAAVAVIENGVPVFAKTYGQADISGDVALTPNTPFELASVSKQFTAYAIAMLAANNKLSITDKLSHYIDELAPLGDQINIHHLVHHLSGIKDYEESLTGSDLTRSNILKTLYSQEDTYFPPGDNYRYSNGGYVLLAEIVERAADEQFGNWLYKNIFLPLKMETAFVAGASDKMPAHAAKSFKKHNEGYDDINVSSDGYQEIIPDLDAVGAAHVHASLNDMIKWANNYRNNTIGGQYVSDLIDDGIIAEQQPWDYLFGLKQFKDRGLLRRGHEGLTHGYRTVFAWFPEEDVAFIYLTNDGEWRSFYLAEKVIDVFLGDKMNPKAFK